MTRYEAARECAQAMLDTFADEAKWTQGTWARNKRGRTIQPFDAQAVCWCAGGFLRKFLVERQVYSVTEMELADAFWSAADSMYGTGLVTVNDVEGLEAVRAIAREVIRRSS